MKAVYAWAIEVDKKLRATQFRQVVTVQEHHGDFVYLNRSALLKRRGEYVVVFTEHDGFHVYALDEVCVTVGKRWP